MDQKSRDCIPTISMPTREHCARTECHFRKHRRSHRISKRHGIAPASIRSRMIFSDLRIFIQTVYPKDEGSPLVLDIDETKSFKLKYSQNIFRFRCRLSTMTILPSSCIRGNWKGFYDGWSRPGEKNVIRFTNLNPGHYIARSCHIQRRSAYCLGRSAAWTSLSSNPSG